MESSVTDDLSQNAEIKEKVSSPTVSKSAQDFEINQNYLIHFDTEDNENGNSKSALDITGTLPIKENGQADKLGSNESKCVEEETKTNSRLILQVRKKPSFMVSAILERTEPAEDLQAEERQSEIDSSLMQLSKNIHTGHFDNDSQAEERQSQFDSPLILFSQNIHTGHGNNDSQAEDISRSKESVSGQIDNTCGEVIIAETIIESNNSTKTGEPGAGISNFTSLLDHFSFQKENSNNWQIGKFESKINEIKGIKEGQVHQLNEINQERKVRKRKQERPQSISFKIGGHTNETLNEDKSHVGRKSKRKQNITKRYYRYDTDTDAENSKEIKQTPLCSKLCASDVKRSSTFPRRNIIVDSEENSQSEDSNIPCTTNRYRRHFLKQLRNAEAAKTKAQTEPKPVAVKLPESDVMNEHNVNVDNNEDYDSDDDYFFDGKRIKMSEIEESLDSTKCKVCNKEFSDIGTLMAHFICHSALEKEQAKFMQFRQDINPSSTLEPSTYFCHLCNQKFSNIATLQEHVLEHSMNFTAKPQSHYECSLCMKTFATAGSLYLHKKAHTGDNPYTCNQCNKHFRDKTRLTTHMRVHTGEKPFTCDICMKTFSQKGNLKLHQQKIHLGLKHSKHRCGKCDINFSDKSDLKEHLQKVHDDVGSHNNKSRVGSKSKSHSNKTGSTSSIGYSSENVDGVEHFQHISNALKKSNMKYLAGELSSGDKIKDTEQIGLMNKECIDASTSFDDGASEHSNSSVSANSSMVDDETVKASLNDFRGVFGMGLGDVVETSLLADSSKPANFICPICDIRFQTAKGFNEHFLSHESVAATVTSKPPLAGYSMIAQSGSEFPSGVKKVYRCEECSLDFVSFPEFQNHLKSHKDNTSKVMCNICQKQMSSSNLLDHMRIHTGEKPYGCVHCGKLFRRSHHLQTHLRTHTGDRPYSCVECGKTFARGDHLQNHKRTHTGEKPYKCDTCDKSYSQSHHLLRHKRTHTGEKPYNCQMCDKRFSRDHHLKKHMETHRVVIYTGDRDSGTNRYTNYHNNLKIKLEQPTSPMTTRATDRIAQLMSAGWYGNMASELMADMVKRHLMAEKDTGATADTEMQDYTEYVLDSVTESTDLNQSFKADDNENVAEKVLESGNESAAISEALHNGEAGKEAALQKRDNDEKEGDIEQTISFMNQLRAISIASTFEEIVNQRLNEDLDIGIVASEKKTDQ